MSKSIYTLVSEIKHNLTLIEQRAPANKSLSLEHHSKSLEAENKRLKRQLDKANKSQAQYKGMYERKNKQLLRLQEDVKRLERSAKPISKNAFNEEKYSPF